MRVVLLAALASACSFTPGTFGGGSDGGDSTTNPGCVAWNPLPKHVTPCALPAPSGALVITAAQSPWSLDTTTGMLSNNASSAVAVANGVLTQSGGPDVLALSVDSFTVEASAVLNVVGDKPLIVASWDTITVAGTIEAGSKIAMDTIGAGSNPAVCSTTPPTSGQGAVGANDAAGGGSGGGGGGGFRGAGGRGGPGDTGAENPGGLGGSALGAFPTVVRGGCSGGASGEAGPDGANATRRARGGAGGGAFQLTARGAMAIQTGAQLLAGGAGGAGTLFGDANGGGGGGAGGYIGLEAASLAIAGAILAANGGGGGGSAPFAGTGTAGEDGQPSATPAQGGAISSCSLPGGPGGAGAMLDGTGAEQTGVNCGGGGGGGAVGFIGVFSDTTQITGSVISPAHDVNPF